MGWLNTKIREKFLLAFGILLHFMAWFTESDLLLIGKNLSLSFNDLEAKLAPSVKESGEIGVIYLADPLNACAKLKKAVEVPSSPFVLILRGDCTFDDKVRNAQIAGFRAAIVYDNEDNQPLISMSGTSGGIHIYGVFISKASGETLKPYADRTDIKLWIIPTFENSAWSVLAITFILLLAMSAVLAACFFLRRETVGRRPVVKVLGGQVVKALPSLIFTSVREDNCNSACAICLEDYCVGEKLRILPCCHKFHAVCVDAWLTSWRSFCPICKRGASTTMTYPPASESTPLLSRAASSVPGALRTPNLQRSCSNRTSSGSAAELEDASLSHWSCASIVDSRSLGYPASSSCISSHDSSCNPTPSHDSASYVGDRGSCLRRWESGPSLSAMEFV